MPFWTTELKSSSPNWAAHFEPTQGFDFLARKTPRGREADVEASPRVSSTASRVLLWRGWGAKTCNVLHVSDEGRGLLGALLCGVGGARDLRLPVNTRRPWLWFVLLA